MVSSSKVESPRNCGGFIYFSEADGGVVFSLDTVVGVAGFQAQPAALCWLWLS